MLGLYLCARKHRLPGYNIHYNDIEYYPGIDYVLDCRLLLRNISSKFMRKYDYFIATPPCNFYSRANYRRNQSTVALMTKDLLPLCLEKLSKLKKPYIIENVLNDSLILKDDQISKIIKDNSIYYIKFGGHIFFTNIFMFNFHKSWSHKQNKQNVCRNKRDGNYNVDLVIKEFLRIVVDNN